MSNKNTTRIIDYKDHNLSNRPLKFIELMVRVVVKVDEDQTIINNNELVFNMPVAQSRNLLIDINGFPVNGTVVEYETMTASDISN